MRRLWGRSNSANVMKVVWGLEELGLSYERMDAGGSFGKTDTPGYRAKNPNGLVPTLEEDGFVLWESNAILRYLCAAHASGSSLWPGEPRACAIVDRWMDWQQTTLNGPMVVVFWQLVRTPLEKRDQAAITKAVQGGARAWEILDAELARHPYVAGTAFTIGDIPIGVLVHRWYSLPIDRPRLPRLRAWYDRLLERPPYRTYVAGPLS